MNKFRLLSKISALIMVMMLLLSCTGMDINFLEANNKTSDAPANDLSSNQNTEPASYCSHWLCLISDAPDENVFEYGAGETIRINYTIYSPFDADEYRITCSGENITLLSPAEYSTADQADSYALEFLAPECGNGKITLKLTAYSNGEILGWASSAIYCSSSDLGIYLSQNSGSAPKLLMAKARFDANQITSYDYWHLVFNQHFVVDYDLINMLAMVASDKIEYSFYAAPYVEAIHNSLFGIESDAKVPDISDTLEKISEDLGIDLEAWRLSRNETTANVQEPPADSESHVSKNTLMQSGTVNSTITIAGKVQWKDYGNTSRPASNIRIQILDSYEWTDILGGTRVIETILKGNDGSPITTNSNGNFSISVSDGASVRAGGYDIVVRVLAEGSNVYVTDPGFLGVYYTYTFDSNRYDDIANNPIPNVCLIAYQGANDDDYLKAIQVQQAAALASNFAKITNGGNYFKRVRISYPVSGSSCYHKHGDYIEINQDRYNVWDVIAHEYGHFVQDKLGTCASPGGSHGFPDDLWSDGRPKDAAVKLAWSEGWATYFGIYAQNYMVDNGHIGNYTVQYGTLNDLLFRLDYNIETPTYKLGETNESSVAAVLWDLTDDSGSSESFDSLHFNFKTLWDYTAGDKCINFDSFINILNTKFNFADKLELGNILSEYHISPNLTAPASGTRLSLTSPSFEWTAGGSPNHPNNSFNMIICNPSKTDEVYRTLTISASQPPQTQPQTTFDFTIAQTDWAEIINKWGGSRLYWMVEGSETTHTQTGPYQSNYHNFICPMQTPVLNVDSASYNSVTLSWLPVTGATSYRITRSDSINGTYQWVANVPDAQTTYTNPGLTTEKTYYYKIKAIGTLINSEDSDAVSAVPAYEFYYELNPDGTLTITGYFGSSLNIVIPPSITGKTVTKIGNFAFRNTLGLISIEIPNSVISVGDYAFSNCSDLSEILLPENLIHIGNRAFAGTKSLTSIVIPNSVTSIGEWAFSDSSITDIKLSSNMTQINIGVFSQSKLKSITIPNSITKIGDFAFSNCYDLENVKLSNNLTYIGNSAFGDTTSLSRIAVPDSVTDIGDWAFAGSLITSIKIPKNITEIKNGVFSSTKLTKIDIPEGVVFIRDHAFFGCDDLLKVTLANGITHIGNWVFQDCFSMKNISIPKNIEYIGSYAFANCTNLTKIDINKLNSTNDRIIDNFAFLDCSALKSLKIDTAESIGMFAFIGCNSLKEVELNNVSNVGMFAFSGCANIKNVDLKNVKKIERFAFTDCENLKNLCITNAKTIDEFAFSGCNSLSSAKIDAKSIGAHAFTHCEKLKDLKLEGVETIEDYAFYRCSALKKIGFSNSMKSIGDRAFMLCTQLKDITIPNSVMYLGSAAFCECTSLKKAVLPGSITVINYSTFAGCSNLSDVKMGEGIGEILRYAFAGCTKLKKISIPNSVWFVDEEAFLDSGISF